MKFLYGVYYSVKTGTLTIKKHKIPLKSFLIGIFYFNDSK